MSDVFISYSRRDLQLVRRLAAALQSAGKDVFVDVAESWRSQPQVEPEPAVVGAATAGGAPAPAGAPQGERAAAELHGIPPSARWLDEIKAAIAGADAVVAVITPAFATSVVSRDEIAHAVSLNKRIVPVLAEPTDPETLLPELAALQWLPLDGNDGFATDVERLVAALDTDLERVRLHTRLLVRAEEWKARGGDRSLLLRGRDLAEAESWLAAQGGQQPAALPVQGELVLASRRAASRRQRGSAGAALVIAAAMVILAVFALLQRSQAVHQQGVAERQRAIAVHQSQVAQSGELAAESDAAGNTDIAVQSLLAVAAARRSPTVLSRAALVGAAEQPLEWIRETGQEGNAVAYDPSGKELAVGTKSGVSVFSAGGALLHRLDVGRQVDSVAFQPAGNLLAVGDGPRPGGTGARGAAGMLRLYGTRRWNQVSAKSFSAAVTHVAFSRDGAQLAAVTDGGGVFLTSSAGPSSSVDLGAGTVLLSAAFDPAGTTLAVSGIIEQGAEQGAGIVEAFRAGAGTRLGGAIAHLSEPGNQFGSIAYAPGGGVLYAVDLAAHLDVLDASDLTKRQTIDLASRGVSVAVNPGGSIVATGDSEGAIQLWNPTSGTELGRPMHDGSIAYGVAFSPNGGQLASADLDGDVVVWRTDGLPALATVRSAPGEVLSLSVNSRSTMLAGVVYMTSGHPAGDGIVDLWPASGTGKVSDLSERYSFSAAVFSPVHPDVIALGDNDGNVYSYDLTTSSSRLLFHDANQVIEELGYSNDGSELALGDGAGLVVVLDAASGRVIRRCPPTAGASGVTSFSFEPNGTAIATATQFGGVRIFSLRDRSAPPRYVSVDESADVLQYTPNGALLLEGDLSGDVEEFDATTLSSRGLLRGDGSPIEQLALTPDGSTLATVDVAGFLHLWDLGAGQQLGTGVATSSSTVLAAAFGPSGSLLATGDTAGDLVLWPRVMWSTDVAAFAGDLCPRVGRNLTAVEWRQYVPGQRYQQICPVR